MSQPRTVLITGASSGIGRATAHEFARRGDALVLVSRSRTTLEEAAHEATALGAAEAVVCPADVTEESALRRVVEETVARRGRIDVVVHAAQTMAYGRVEDVPTEVFEAVVDTAVRGTANLARAVLPQFRGQRSGSLVVVGSLLASIAAPFMGSYTTAKWAQLGLVRTLQIETRDVPGVHVSMVSPGGVDTPIYYQAASYLGTDGRPPPPVYTPQRVARHVLGVVDKPRRNKQSGFANPLVIAGFRFLPGVYDALVTPLLTVFGLAKHTVPANPGSVFAPRPEREATRGRWHGI
jgi:NAD(P)-dependent dehydrogenase (short-subunit alcohol dehydrogenase family)